MDILQTFWQFVLLTLCLYSIMHVCCTAVTFDLLLSAFGHNKVFIKFRCNFFIKSMIQPCAQKAGTETASIHGNHVDTGYVCMYVSGIL